MVGSADLTGQHGSGQGGGESIRSPKERAAVLATRKNNEAYVLELS
ncbi:MAG: hypothetical protein WBN15_07095 [Polyangiales bacterium]